APSRPVQPPATEVGWHTPADEGWRAVSTMGRQPDPEVTGAGLPQRQPMEKLMPGSVAEPPTGPARQRRSADAVRGMLSSYHRGLQRGRSGDSSAPSAVWSDDRADR
ncbi:MAG: hypothetical protein WCA46_12615, partial [Actinocatenispora sp.]